MKAVWVLMQNDYPHSVYTSEEAMQRARLRLEKAEQARRQRPNADGTRIYYHPHSCDLDPVEEEESVGAVKVPADPNVSPAKAAGEK